MIEELKGLGVVPTAPVLMIGPGPVTDRLLERDCLLDDRLLVSSCFSAEEATRLLDEGVGPGGASLPSLTLSVEAERLE